MDNEVLGEEDLTALLGQNADTIRSLFEDGTLPGQCLAGKWYISRRKLIDFIENGSGLDEEIAHGAKDPIPTEFLLRGLNMWQCESCRKINESDVAVCEKCKTSRMTPLVNYMPRERRN